MRHVGCSICIRRQERNPGIQPTANLINRCFINAVELFFAVLLGSNILDDCPEQNTTHFLRLTSHIQVVRDLRSQVHKGFGSATVQNQSKEMSLSEDFPSTEVKAEPTAHSGSVLFAEPYRSPGRPTFHSRPKGFSGARVLNCVVFPSHSHRGVQPTQITS